MEAEINKAVTFLQERKVILYPTDTVWGIGCDATNKKAGRPHIYYQKAGRPKKPYYFAR